MGTKTKKDASRGRTTSRRSARGALAVEVGQRMLWTRLALSKLGKAPKSQQDFAKSVGILKTSYNNYETGDTMLGPDSAAKIYARYGISLNWLYLGVVDDLPSTLHDAIASVRSELE